MATELVIFDCDGVLVDSERISCGMLAEGLTELGLPMDLSRSVELFMGTSNRDSMRVVEELLGRPLPKDFRASQEQRKFEEFRRSLQAIPGIDTALDGIPVATCVASSGTHERIRLTLGLTGLLKRFEGRIFSATQVTHGKPAPDLFLFAAQSMGFEPAQCAVVEDSVPGVQAAVAAGMRVFGYADLVAPERLREAGAEVISDMSLLPKLLSSS